MFADQDCLFCGMAGCEVCGQPESNIIDLFDRNPVRPAGRWDREIAATTGCLEDLLERSRMGEFTGICAVLDGPSGTATVITFGAMEDPIPYLGGMSRLSHRLNTELDYDGD